MSGADYDGLPPFEQLTSQVPEQEPGELSALMRHHMGEADAPPARRDPAAPDVSGLRHELGL